MLTTPLPCVLIVGKEVDSTVKDRIKAVRKALGLTQQALADRLGIKQNTVAQYEIGRNEPIDAVVTLLCREFRVNETWLRTGEGEMFQAVDREKEIAAFISDIISDPDKDFQRRFVSALSRLEPAQWELISDFADKLTGTDK